MNRKFCEKVFFESSCSRRMALTRFSREKRDLAQKS